ncbi:uncharacterized protein LOC129234404 [Uloborus diversus]|uniref:uncharacterized protein LOC129234404 n=1 Tax=Uloborus diversus TaxID=327109 RepID=UPI002409AA7E|nr:uncharacterized protein LOC129234404 [Uloborus diversus]
MTVLKNGDLNMLHTQLVKLAAPKTPGGATDDDSDIGHPKAEVLPPTLFSKLSTPESPDDPFEDPYDAKFSTLNRQMKSSFTETGNTETRFFWMIDQMSFQQLFRLYAKVGDHSRSGEFITSICSDRWLRQAKILDNRRISTTDTGIYFKQVAKFKKALCLNSYMKFLELLATKKHLNLSEMKYKMVTCGPPVTLKTTAVDNRNAPHRTTERSRVARHYELTTIERRREQKRKEQRKRTYGGFFSNCQCQHGYSSQICYSFPDQFRAAAAELRDEDWFPEE